MAEVKPIKKDTDKRVELKPFTIDLPGGEEDRIDAVVQINRILSQYNTKIRTSKSIEITGVGRLKLPNLSAAPTTCLVGELIVVSGVLNICSAVDTFTIVGTQS